MNHEARSELRTEGRPDPGFGPAFWVALVVGWSVIGFGIHNAVRNVPGLRKPVQLAQALIAGLVVHDGIWIPVAIGVGVLTRWLPSAARAPVRVGLALTAMLTIATAPVTRRYGADPANPSIDPNHATTGLLVYLAIIWAASAVWCGLRVRARASAR